MHLCWMCCNLATKCDVTWNILAEEKRWVFQPFSTTNTTLKWNKSCNVVASSAKTTARLLQTFPHTTHSTHTQFLVSIQWLNVTWSSLQKEKLFHLVNKFSSNRSVFISLTVCVYVCVPNIDLASWNGALQIAFEKDIFFWSYVKQKLNNNKKTNDIWEQNQREKNSKICREHVYKLDLIVQFVLNKSLMK